MKYGSICSGIEAASVAFQPLDWEPAWFSEIEAFPNAVLAHHYPGVQNHGDMSNLADKILAGEIEAPDMICGGPPCQAFSVAGSRQSLSDKRGNLTLEYIRICDANDAVRSADGREATWILYENVPGLLSVSDNAFGAFLGGLVGRTAPIPEPADGWTGAGVVDGPTRCAAWRVLNAEFFGLAQRRKRVFVLAKGGAGRWAAADALLPLIESSRWHPAPSRGTGERVAATIACRAGGGGDLNPETSGGGNLIPMVMATGQASAMSAPTIDMAPTLSCNHEAPILMRMREGKEGGGKGPLVSEDQSLTLATGNDQVLAFQDISDCLTSAYGTKWNGNASAENGSLYARHGMQVRRLTPVETSRLQGFPDTYCHIPTAKWRKIPTDEAAYLQSHGLHAELRGQQWYTNIAADGPIYKANGNSWAVPCARWIFRRIQKVDDILKKLEA